jgi:hypothetical protein
MQSTQLSERSRNGIVLGARVDLEVAKKIDGICRRWGMHSRSEVIRLAFTEFVERHGTEEITSRVLAEIRCAETTPSTAPLGASLKAVKTVVNGTISGADKRSTELNAVPLLDPKNRVPGFICRDKYRGFTRNAPPAGGQKEERSG